MGLQTSIIYGHILSDIGLTNDNIGWQYNGLKSLCNQHTIPHKKFIGPYESGPLFQPIIVKDLQQDNYIKLIF